MSSAFLDKDVLTPVQFVTFICPNGDKRQFWVKRDDLIDSQISGNKWRKLKFNIRSAIDQGYSGIASFGGAFSNHIAALAAVGSRAGIKTLGFIRSHEIDNANPTLAQARALGMRLIPLSRLDYKQRHQTEFVQTLMADFPDYYVVPEGGSNDLAEPGLIELAKEIQSQVQVDTIACAIGSGGTISGLIAGNPDIPHIGVAVVKDQELLTRLRQTHSQRLHLDDQMPFGGYGKFNDELEAFCLDFFRQTQIPIEPIYTGKLFHALCTRPDSLGISPDTKVLAVHTGGLQGLQGLIYRRRISTARWQPIISSLAT